MRQFRQESADPEPVYVGIVTFSKQSAKLLGLSEGDVSDSFTDVTFARMMDLHRGGQLETGSEVLKYDSSLRGRINERVKAL